MGDWAWRKLDSAVWRVRSRWASWLAASTTRSAIARADIGPILVVCYGNIYRSAYAAALLDALLGDCATVHSGGFHMRTGRPAPADVIEQGLRRGVDLHRHRSRCVTARDVQDAAIIVVMDRHNWVDVRRLGGSPSRIVWLGELDGGGEITDPYGCAADQVERIVTRLHACSERLAELLAGRYRSSSG